MHPLETSVKKLLTANDGHGFDHIERVRGLALKFAAQEHADARVVELASLLHDVDDYKLFGEENAKGLLNARRILDENNVDDDTKVKVLDIIATMGYSKSLEGIRPATLEGKIVSDADMCDAIGSQGILRTHAYNLSKGGTFFDKTIAPQDDNKTSSEYKAAKPEHSVQHFFDKLLKINSILLTTASKREGSKRQKIMVDFLRELFREEGAEEWEAYLDTFIARNS